MNQTGALADVIRAAVDDGRDTLFEHEVYALLKCTGCHVPRHLVWPVETWLQGGDACESSTELSELLAAAGGRVVLKVVSTAVSHKSDVGGVRLVEGATPDRVLTAGRDLLAGLPEDVRPAVTALMLVEAVDHQPGPGREMFVGLRHSAAFGPVFAVGFGGTAAEALDASLREGRGTVLLGPGVTTDEQRRDRLAGSLFFRWASGGLRGLEAIASPDELEAEIVRWLDALAAVAAAAEAAGRRVEELELNPVVWTTARGGGWIPLDGLLRLGAPEVGPPAFPVANLRRALQPRRVAVLGASPRRVNLGRIILRSALAAGFSPDNLLAVREGVEPGTTIDGVRCVGSLQELAELESGDGPASPPVDLLVVAVKADQVVGVVDSLFDARAARCGLLVTAGMGETEGGRGIEAAVRDRIAAAGAVDPERPVLVGGNCLGLWSRPAHFDSFFVPVEKLPRPSGPRSSLAIVSQSGAFLLTVLGRLTQVVPDVLLSLGNQVDTRVSHAVEALAEWRGAGEDDVEADRIRTIGLYIEGLKPGDGSALAARVRTLTRAGLDVIIYKGGRNALGRAAAEGHTASMAGDYRVFTTLLRDAGAILADSLPDFLALVRLSVALRDKRVAGGRLGFVTNAGYEAVSMADWHAAAGPHITASELSGATRARIGELLTEHRLDRLVNVANPLDLTPMAGDAVHLACARAFLDDDGVDAAVFGTVPLAPGMKSLPHGFSDVDVFDAPDGYAPGFARLFSETDKPFVVVIDAGTRYDPMVELMASAGVPVFHSADRAALLLGRYLESRLRRR